MGQSPHLLVISYHSLNNRMRRISRRDIIYNLADPKLLPTLLTSVSSLPPTQRLTKINPLLSLTRRFIRIITVTTALRDSNLYDLNI